MSIPDAITRAALDATPLSAADFVAWRAHLYPLDPESEVRAWAGLVPGRSSHSTCGTHALACYREAGVEGCGWGAVADVLGPYAPLAIRGGAIAALETLARAHGAYRLPSEAGDVGPGAVLVVGPSTYTSSPHAIVVTEVAGPPTGGYLPLVTSEGGQSGARGPTDVRQRSRELCARSPGAWVVRDRGSNAGRQLLYWVDPARLRSL